MPETSLLQMAKDAMIGSAKLAAAMLGTSTIANGFAVTPTGPASLQIVVAPGEIYAMANIDSLAFSTLPADTTHSILKQGIMLDGVTLSCPAPTTTGQSINYLVQVTYQDQDSTPVLLPYYNSANPALPYSGMGNNGMTQNTSRKGVAIVQVKAGASAATGSQVTPAPDSGYVGLFVATVAYGQTTITSGNITQYAGAPLLPSGVLQSIQGGNTTYALDTGAVNACAATFFPAITSLVDGLTLRFKAANSNTGAATFSPNGISAAPIVGGNHAALQGGEIAATGDVWVQWNSSIGGGSWVLVESSGGGLQVASGTKSQHATSAAQAQTQSVTAFTSGGVSTALTLTPVPAIAAYAANQRFRVKFSVASTGADTLNVSGLGVKNLKQYDSTGAKVAAVFAANQLGDIEYDGADFVLLDQLPAAGRLIGIQYFGASGTYTPNPLTKSYIVKIVAGGGAGGAARATSTGYYSGGAGGGAGGYAESRITDGIAPVAVTIGVGGVSTLNANGGNGGNSSFGSITCVGGTGGSYQSTQFTTGTVTQVAGADGGSATGGNLINGAGGQGQRLLLLRAGNNTAGNGGQSFWSAGGGGARGSNGTGAPGTYGSGGGGSLSESAPAGAVVAGVGGTGFCIVEEYA